MQGYPIVAIALVCGVAEAPAGPRFADGSDAFPVAHVYAGGWEHFVGGGVAVFDCNGDALPDIVAAGGTEPARLFVNATPGPGADPAFAPGPGLPALTGATGAYPIDIDSDGHTDLALLRVGANVLLKGDGACGFAPADWGFEGGAAWSTAFSATWEADAAWPTLAIGNYVNRDDPDGPFEACDTNMLHRPGPVGYAAPTPLAPGFCALSMLFSDWQRTGTPELRISNDRHYYVHGGYEQMWRLLPLAERAEADGWDRVSIWGMGIASADLHRDGHPDVMLTSMGDQVLHLNAGGTLTPAPFALGVAAQRPHAGGDGRPSTGWHAEFGDVDNDGRLDLFIAKGNVDQMPTNAMEDPNNLLMQAPGGTFAEASVAAGVATMARSRGAALADVNLDGRLDIVVANRRAPLELWVNETPDTGGWATVDLRQPAPNTHAIGAWLEIETPLGTEWRERTIGGGHVSGQLLPFHVGLGDADGARLRVTWPDGAVSDWHRVRAGERLTIERD